MLGLTRNSALFAATRPLDQLDSDDPRYDVSMRVERADKNRLSSQHIGT